MYTSPRAPRSIPTASHPSMAVFVPEDGQKNGSFWKQQRINSKLVNNKAVEYTVK